MKLIQCLIHSCVSVNTYRMNVKVAQLCPTLCDPMDYTIHGMLQAKILEWLAFPFSRESSQPRDWTQVSHIAGGFFTSWATKAAQKNELSIGKIWQGQLGKIPRKNRIILCFRHTSLDSWVNWLYIETKMDKTLVLSSNLSRCTTHPLSFINPVFVVDQPV